MGQRDAAEIHQATLSHHPSTDCFLGTAVLSQRKSQHHLMMSPYRHSESWDTDRFVLSIHSLLWQCCAGAIHDHWLACRKKLTPAKLSMILWLCYMLLGLCWAWRPCCGTFWKLLLQIVLMSGLILDRLCSRLPTFHTVPPGFTASSYAAVDKFTAFGQVWHRYFLNTKGSVKPWQWETDALGNVHNTSLCCGFRHS